MRIWVKKSPIQGRGVFAAGPLKRGRYIASAEGPRTEADGRYVLWILEGEGSYRGMKLENQLRYLNHSSKPNADFWGADLYAIRSIKPGEEITLYYGDGWEDVD